ncbi:MAG: hypothetical protein ACK5LZ_01795, partial [Anaerorhabdus sp.]
MKKIIAGLIFMLVLTGCDSLTGLTGEQSDTNLTELVTALYTVEGWEVEEIYEVAYGTAVTTTFMEYTVTNFEKSDEYGGVVAEDGMDLL